MYFFVYDEKTQKLNDYDIKKRNKCTILINYLNLTNVVLQMLKIKF